MTTFRTQKLKLIYTETNIYLSSWTKFLLKNRQPSKLEKINQQPSKLPPHWDLLARVDLSVPLMFCDPMKRTVNRWSVYGDFATVL